MLTSINVINSRVEMSDVASDKSLTSSSNCFDKILEESESSQKEVLTTESKEKVFKLCTKSSNDINSLDAYVSMRKAHSDTSGLSDSDYEAEYAEYIDYCGCMCEAELKEINSYGYKTKGVFLEDVKTGLLNAASIIKNGSGFSISEDDLDTLISRSQIEDLAEFVKSDRTSVSKILKNFTTLLNKTAELNKLSAFKYSNFLKFLSTTIEALKDIILDYYHESECKTEGAQDCDSVKLNSLNSNAMLVLNLI